MNRKITIAGVTGVLIIAVAIGGTKVAPTAPATPPASDASLQASMTRNITDSYGDASWRDELIDWTVKDSILIVAIYPRAMTLAPVICGDIAAITNSGDTAKPLGIGAVIVEWTSGSTTCYPPK